MLSFPEIFRPTPFDTTHNLFMAPSSPEDSFAIPARPDRIARIAHKVAYLEIRLPTGKSAPKTLAGAVAAARLLIATEAQTIWHHDDPYMHALKILCSDVVIAHSEQDIATPRADIAERLHAITNADYSPFVEAPVKACVGGLLGLDTTPLIDLGLPAETVKQNYHLMEAFSRVRAHVLQTKYVPPENYSLPVHSTLIDFGTS